MTDPHLAEGEEHSRVPRRALKWAFAMNWGRRGFGTLFTVLLAAILGPRDFGIVALALVYVGFVELFVEQGVLTAIVQRKNLEDAHLDSAFWMNLAWCLGLAAASVALSGWWAELNGVPELESVIKVLSITLVMWGFAIVPRALLERAMAFKKLAIRANVATLVGGCVGIGLALAGAGVWSLVGQILAQEATAIALVCALARWVPRLHFSRRHLRELFGFSVNVFIANVAGFLTRRSDILVMGFFFSPVVIGIYRLADRIVETMLELSVRPIALITLPHFSRLQDDPEALRRSVASCLRLTIVIVVPAMLVLAACSDYILGVLGSAWSEGDMALKLLAVIGIVKALIFFSGPLLFAVARPGFRAITLWAQALLSAAVVVAAGAALETSSVESQLTGTTAARALLFLLVFLPANIAIVTYLTGLRVREVMRWFPLPLVSGLAAVGAVALVGETGVFGELSAVPALLISAAIAVGAALGTLLLLERDVRGETTALLRRARSVGPAAEPDPSLTHLDP